jgi:hypothetical protein
MRDDNDYHSMNRIELRAHLVRVAKELATWQYALSQSAVEESRYWTDGYSHSNAKSTTERKAEADVHAGPFTREKLENQGYVGFFTTIRDLIVELLREPDIDNLLLED